MAYELASDTRDGLGVVTVGERERRCLLADSVLGGDRERGRWHLDEARASCEAFAILRSWLCWYSRHGTDGKNGMASPVHGAGWKVRWQMA